MALATEDVLALTREIAGLKEQLADALHANGYYVALLGGRAPTVPPRRRDQDVRELPAITKASVVQSPNAPEQLVRSRRKRVPLGAAGLAA